MFLQEGISQEFASEMDYQQFSYLFEILKTDILHKSGALSATKTHLDQVEEDIANCVSNITKMAEIEGRHQTKRGGLDKKAQELELRIASVKNKIKKCVE